MEATIIKLSQALAMMTQGAVLDLVYFSALLTTVRDIQVGTLEVKLTSAAVESALEELNRVTSGTLAQSMIPDLDNTTNWWYDFVDRIVDKLSLTYDSRLNDFKATLHDIIDASTVLDLTAYADVHKLSTGLFK